MLDETVPRPRPASHPADDAPANGTVAQSPADVSRLLAASDLVFEPAGYKVFEELGRGAIGTVYRAEMISLGRAVALKTILVSEETTDAARELFEKESLLMARLQHPNIEAVYDVGQSDGRLFSALELLDGEDAVTGIRGLTVRFAGNAGQAEGRCVRTLLFTVNSSMRPETAPAASVSCGISTRSTSRDPLPVRPR